MRTRRAGLALFAAEVGVVAVLACSERAPTEPYEGPQAAQPGDLLGDTRIAAAGARAGDWQQYVATSRKWAEADRDTIQAEMERTRTRAWTAAPLGADYRLTQTPGDAWFASAAARSLADVVVSFQTPSGGWSKAVDFSQARKPAQSFGSEDSWHWIGTFDNGATTEELRLLGEVARVQNGERFAQSYNRGLHYILTAQFPNGCWPQVYPLEGSYHDAATINDNMFVRLLDVLSTTSKGGLPFVSAADRASAAQALTRAIDCILSAQVVSGGTKTAWAQQFDPITLLPVQGRAYEPAALVSLESAPVLDALMSISNPDDRVVQAVRAAAAWFKQSAIYGYDYLSSGALQARAGAGPLWARFYELNTNRPIFGDRDNSIHYDVTEISAERRGGYAWYTTAPAATMQRYENWRTLNP